ncbi:MAG TPA: gluconate 2-dehydrogenase subunit 3 family protein [Puia sp.]|nr:gluconate 2-dehydrogenase subunit 3 family protein [Puia sp.]
MKRRSAIRLSLGLAVGGALGFGGIKGYQLYKHPDFRVLEEHQGLLDDLADTIIPATDSPGARDAAVGGFILKMVRDCTDKKSQNNFIRGFMDLMERTGEKEGTSGKAGSSFGQRSLAERTAILAHFEQQGRPYSGTLGKVQHRLAGDSFFTILKRYTILGYCSSRRGATEGLRYDYIPGRYDGNVPLQPGQRSWATQ